MRTYLASVALLLAATALPAADAVVYLKLHQAMPWEVVRGDQRLGWQAKSVALSDPVVECTWRHGAWDSECWVHHPVKIGQWTKASLQVSDGAADRLHGVISVKVPATSAHRPGGVMTGGTATWTIAAQQLDGVWQGTVTGTAAATFDWSQEKELTLAFDLDSWSPSAHSRSLRSTLLAHVANAEVTGTISASATTAAPARVGDELVLDHSKHPHLFFTKDDLPALRQKMTTPLGQRYLAAMERLQQDAEEHGFGFHQPKADHSMQSSWAAALGFRYQLTGDKQLAEQARRYVWSGMYASLPNLNQWRQSHRILGVAIAYDLCGEAWDPEFRKNVYHYLLGHALTFSRRLDIRDPLNFGGLYGYGGQTETFTAHVDHTEGRRYMCAAGVAAMAIMGDAPPIYRPKDLSDSITIAAVDDYDPLPGVPIVNLHGGHMFKRWLLNGPFHLGDKDPLAALGGFAKARPIPGTVVVKEGVELDFRHYIPTGSNDRKRGPHIYPRNCAMYYDASTGQGYWPGRKLRKIYQEKKLGGTALTWYTVWDNKAEQYVQCFPNYYWQSRGGRMWLNGVEVTDQQIVKVAPGLVPVMVYLPVTGGYSNQGPHLRWYSAERLAEETARTDACEAAFEAQGEALPRMLARAIGREIRHFLLTRVDRRGWNAATIPEHLYPFLLAYRHVFGVDLGRDTGAAQVAPLAAFGRELYHSRATAHALYHAFPLLDETDQRVARWYYDRYPLPTRRPVDYILPFVTHDMTVEPLAPDTVHAKAQWYPDRQVAVFNRTWARDGGDDFSVILDGTGRLGNGRAALTLEMAGIRKDRRGATNWLRGGGGTHLQLRDYGSQPYLQTYYNDEPARLIARAVAPDGSGAVTMEIGPLYKGKIAGRKPAVVPAGKPLADSSIRRSLYVDYSGDAGVPVVVVICDRYRGLPDNQGRFFQFFCGTRLEQVHVEPGSGHFRIEEREHGRRGKLASALSGRVFGSKPLEFRRFTRNREGTVGIVQAAIGRVKQAIEREADPRNRIIEDEGDDGDLLDLLAETGKAEDALHIKKPRGRPAGSGGQAGDDHVWVAIAVSRDRPPEIRKQGQGAEAVISVGSVGYRFAGHLIRRVESDSTVPVTE